MKNFKTLSAIFTMVATAGLAQAKMIEDGSSFTGAYKIQEPSCYVRQVDPYTHRPVDQIQIKGTPEGLVREGALMAIQQGDFSAKPPMNIAAAQYVSGNEFKDEFILQDCPPGIVKLTEDIVVDAQGNITVTSTNSDPSKVTSPALQVCHYTRLN